jgi:hypothetical protein
MFIGLLPFWLVQRGLQQRQLTDADQLFDAINEIFASLSVGTIEDVFRNRIHRLQQVIELAGDSVG